MSGANAAHRREAGAGGEAHLRHKAVADLNALHVEAPGQHQVARDGGDLLLAVVREVGDAAAYKTATQGRRNVCQLV